MSTDTEQVTSYPLSQVPDFIKKQDLSVEDLEYQCHKLKDAIIHGLEEQVEAQSAV